MSMYISEYYRSTHTFVSCFVVCLLVFGGGRRVFASGRGGAGDAGLSAHGFGGEGLRGAEPGAPGAREGHQANRAMRRQRRHRPTPSPPPGRVVVVVSTAGMEKTNVLEGSRKKEKQHKRQALRHIYP